MLKFLQSVFRRLNLHVTVMLMDTVRDIERIGDHFENIIELIDYRDVNRVKLTEDAMDDLTEMFTLDD